MRADAWSRKGFADCGAVICGLPGMGIDDISGLAEVCDVEQLQEVVEYRLGCNPNMKYFYKGTSKCAPAPHSRGERVGLESAISPNMLMSANM